MSDVTLSVSDGTTMRAWVVRPDRLPGQTTPGMILFQEAFGVNEHIRDVAGRFAGAGFVVVAPEMFHRTADPGFTANYNDFDSVRPHIGALTVDGIAADAQAAHEWLTRDGEVDADHIVAIGYCMGGRCSFIANATLPLSAGVSYYGGGIPAELGKTLNATHLFFWGGKDKHIPRTKRQEVLDVLDQEKKSYINVEFSDADHAFFCDARPAYHEESAKISWAMTSEFFAQQMRS